MRALAVFTATCLILLSDLVLQKHVFAEQWSRFRGPAGTGIVANEHFPAEWDIEKHLRWKAASGKGASSPIVVGERLFLTAFEGQNRFIKCYDVNDGTVLWTKSVRAGRQEVTTPPGGPVNPTPVADESHIYVFFPDAGLFCFKHDGEQRWHNELGPFHSFHGIAASLVLAEGKVFVLADQLQDSFLAAFDCETGEDAWKVTRVDGPIGGYSTPAARVTAKGRTELVVSGPLEVVGYDAASGAQNWAIEGVTNAPISVPVVDGNMIFVCEPSFSENPFKIDALLSHDKNKDGELSFAELESHTPLLRIARRVDQSWGNGDGIVQGGELDKAFASFVGGGGLAAIELDESQQAVTARVKWTYRKTVPQIPSPLVLNDVLFFLNNGGILTSVNPATGEIIKRGRLGRGGTFYASPVAAAGKLLLIDTDGEIAVVSGEGEWKVLSTTRLDETCYATPALAGECVFIRGDQNVYCFGDAG
jgi:outer membrane protein assembly factor BamB